VCNIMVKCKEVVFLTSLHCTFMAQPKPIFGVGLESVTAIERLKKVTKKLTFRRHHYYQRV